MKKRILIVDDEEIVVRSCLRILSGDEFDIDVANNGLEALEKINDQEYDMVILDIMMPKMNGIEVLQREVAIVAQLNMKFLAKLKKS